MIFPSITTKLFFIFFASSVFLGGYFHIKNLQLQIENAIEKQQKLEEILGAKDLQIDSMKNDIKDIKTINEDLKTQFRVSQKEVNDLKEKFLDNQGKQRDFARIATQKPKELQDRINRGTRFALRCNEIVTGSPLRPEDDNNNICPDIIKSKKVETK